MRNPKSVSISILQSELWRIASFASTFLQLDMCSEHLWHHQNMFNWTLTKLPKLWRCRAGQGVTSKPSLPLRVSVAQRCWPSHLEASIAIEEPLGFPGDFWTRRSDKHLCLLAKNWNPHRKISSLEQARRACGLVHSLKLLLQKSWLEGNYSISSVELDKFGFSAWHLVTFSLLFWLLNTMFFSPICTFHFLAHHFVSMVSDESGHGSCTVKAWSSCLKCTWNVRSSSLHEDPTETGAWRRPHTQPLSHRALSEHSCAHVFFSIFSILFKTSLYSPKLKSATILSLSSLHASLLIYRCHSGLAKEDFCCCDFFCCLSGPWFFAVAQISEVYHKPEGLHKSEVYQVS